MKLKKFRYKNVNSTNDVAIKKIKKGFKKGIVISEKQKKGRGRYGKKWISYKGNLFLSIFFEIKKNIQIKKFTKINCLILRNILTKYLERKITIKLPNDLLVDGKKICGILQEKITYNEKIFMVIGIGINIVKNPFIKNYPTTNFFALTGKKISTSKMFNQIKKNYEKRFRHLCI